MTQERSTTAETALELARAALTPTGVLRAAINIGNPILASLHAGARSPHGVSVDIATELARRLGVGLQLQVFPSAGKSVAAVTAEHADIGFFAVDPLRAEGLLFTAPYVLIEGSYLVRAESAITSNDEVDRAGQSVMVGQGSAYDLYLSRTLQHASILRSATSPGVVDEFLLQNADIAAGVRLQLEEDASRMPGLRLLPGRFMEIQQAMGTPTSRGGDAQAYLVAFIEDVKLSGFVRASMHRHGIHGALVAPPRTNG